MDIIGQLVLYLSECRLEIVEIVLMQLFFAAGGVAQLSLVGISRHDAFAGVLEGVPSLEDVSISGIGCSLKCRRIVALERAVLVMIHRILLVHDGELLNLVAHRCHILSLIAGDLKLGDVTLLIGPLPIDVWLAARGRRCHICCEIALIDGSSER